jgi:hypothetical protein
MLAVEPAGKGGLNEPDEVRGGEDPLTIPKVQDLPLKDEAVGATTARPTAPPTQYKHGYSLAQATSAYKLPATLRSG